MDETWPQLGPKSYQYTVILIPLPVIVANRPLEDLETHTV